MLNNSSVNYTIGIVLGIVGASGIIASNFIKDEKPKKICSSLGSALGISAIIPIYIGTQQYYKSIAIYNCNQLKNLKN